MHIQDMSDILEKLTGNVRNPSGGTVDCEALFNSSKHILLYFWSPACMHCTKQTGNFQENEQQLHEQGITIIAVSDQELHESFPSVICDPNNPNNLLNEYNVTVYPTWVFFSAKPPYTIDLDLCSNYDPY